MLPYVFELDATMLSSPVKRRADPTLQALAEDPDDEFPPLYYPEVKYGDEAWVFWIKAVPLVCYASRI